MSDKIYDFKKLLEESQTIAFFSGARVSTESGIPDFRSSEGLYMQANEGYRSAEELISYSFYQRRQRENPWF